MVDIAETILAVLGAITAFGAAFTYIIKAWKALKAPNQNQDKRLDEIDQTLGRHERLLDSDNKRLKTMEEGNAVQMRALLAMVNHMIDNNHTKNLVDTREEINRYLTNR